MFHLLSYVIATLEEKLDPDVGVVISIRDRFCRLASPQFVEFHHTPASFCQQLLLDTHAHIFTLLHILLILFIMNPTTSTTITTTSTTSTTAPSILQRLLSTPAPPPTFDDLLTRPSTSTAPQPTYDDLLPHLHHSQPSTSSSIQEDPPVLHLSDDESDMWEKVLVSTAHPNYWDPELHNLVVEELLGTQQYRQVNLSEPTIPSPRALTPPLQEPRVPSTEPPTPSPQTPTPSPLSPFPSSPSPPSSPLPQLPARRKDFTRLRINTSYMVKDWEKSGNKLKCTIFNQENTELYIIMLPDHFRRPSKSLRLHHLFNSNLYLRITKINGKLNFTFHL